MPDSQDSLTEAGSSQLHIAFGVDKNYFIPVSATIASIVEHNRDLDFVFHVFAPQISKDDCGRFDLLANQYGKKIEIHEIGLSFLEKLSNFPRRRWISEAAFIRLVIPEALKGVTGRVLYIDSDVLCKGSLSELVSLDMGDSIVSVVSDILESRHCPRLALHHGRYFNSGFLYIDIDKWLSADITGKTIMTKIELGERSNMADQDALNIVLDGRAKYIERKWNYQYSIDMNLNTGSTRVSPHDEIALVHFIGPVKPWHFWMPHESVKEFQKYLDLLPAWPTALPEKPNKPKDMHRVSKYLRKQGKYSDSMKWFLKYLMNKYAAPRN